MKHADRFAILAMGHPHRAGDRASTLPTLLPGMNPALMEKALDDRRGADVPILYNDDVNIPAVEHAFELSQEEAEQYVPFGCGEYIINHRSFGTPAG